MFQNYLYFYLLTRSLKFYGDRQCHCLACRPTNLDMNKKNDIVNHYRLSQMPIARVLYVSGSQTRGRDPKWGRQTFFGGREMILLPCASTYLALTCCIVYQKWCFQIGRAHV